MTVFAYTHKSSPDDNALTPAVLQGILPLRMSSSDFCPERIQRIQVLIPHTPATSVPHGFGIVSPLSVDLGTRNWPAVVDYLLW
jgi:hypothetical protein